MAKAKKQPVQKRKGGRQRRWRPEYARQAKALCLLGYTDERMAEFFQVGTATITRWKRDYPEFKEATQSAKEEHDSRIVSALFRRAEGMTVRKQRPVVVGGEVQVIEYEEELPPETGAATVWLYNRQPHLFKKDPTPATEDPAEAASLSISFEVSEPVREVRVTNAKT